MFWLCDIWSVNVQMSPSHGKSFNAIEFRYSQGFTNIIYSLLSNWNKSAWKIFARFFPAALMKKTIILNVKRRVGGESVSCIFFKIRHILEKVSGNSNNTQFTHESFKNKWPSHRIQCYLLFLSLNFFSIAFECCDHFTAMRCWNDVIHYKYGNVCRSWLFSLVIYTQCTFMIAFSYVWIKLWTTTAWLFV